MCPTKMSRHLRAALKPIYKAPTEESALEALDDLVRVWGAKYPTAIRSWWEHWDELATMFKYPEHIRRIIYTTKPLRISTGSFGRSRRPRALSSVMMRF